jgi:hypothetical protein
MTDASNSTTDDQTTRWAFYFFMGTLGFVFLAGLWMLVQMAF